MVAQGLLFASGPFVLCGIPKEWGTEPRTLVISFGTEQFRGRAVQASRDLWIRGASYFSARCSVRNGLCITGQRVEKRMSMAAQGTSCQCRP